MFSKPVKHVAGTRIFAAGGPAGAQALVYSMSVELIEDVAMVLPLPVPPGSAEGAVRFVDLQRYPEFFADLERAFPIPVASASQALASSMAPNTLKIHAVGEFDASFVPTRSDFDRLDARFRVGASVWEALPQYDDFGFAVFKLARGRRKWFGSRSKSYHPMAFVFPRREPTELFFPTVHVHDGTVEATATFDHQLYCQPDDATAETFAWRRSSGNAGRYIDVDRAGELVDPARPLYERSLLGPLPNADVVLRAPEVPLAALRARGQHFRLKLSVHSAYFTRPTAQAAKWAQVARFHMAAVSEHLCSALTDLAERRASSWALASYDEAEPLFGISQDGTTDGKPNFILTNQSTGIPVLGNYRAPTGSGRVSFSMHDDLRIEPQLVELAFSQLPSSALLLEIQSELDAALASVDIP